MFNYTYTINLYKSKLNPSNYYEILVESLNHVVSLDLLNSCLDHMIEDADLETYDKFLLLCINNLKMNIRFQNVFVRSKFQDILRSPINYNVYMKFKQIIDITKIIITTRFESFYNYMLYKQYSNDHALDIKFNDNQLDVIEFNIYKEVLQKIYKYNLNDKEFIEHSKLYGIENIEYVNQENCINNKNINIGVECINIKNGVTVEQLREILTCINTNPVDFNYQILDKIDFTLPQCESLMISFIKTLISKDIYSFKKIYNIFKFVKPTNKILFSYFVYLYITYTKYANRYIRDRILNTVHLTKFSGIIGMIIEYYLSVHPPHADLYSYFAPLCEFMDFSVDSYIHLIYPLLYTKYDITIEKYNHYIKVHQIIHNEVSDTKYRPEYKEIALCLLYGHYDLNMYKMNIKNNMNSILNVIREEYINKNVQTCIFDLLRYFTDVLEINISENVYEYFRVMGCHYCQDKCDEIIRYNQNDDILKCGKNIYTTFLNILGNPTDDIEMIERFLQLYKSDSNFKSNFLSIYDKLPSSVINITGYINHNETNINDEFELCTNIEGLVKYFKEYLVDEIKMDDPVLYNEFMDLLYYNIRKPRDITQVNVSDLKNIKNYHKFLAHLNNILCMEDHPYDILRYTKLFTSRTLEYSIMNLIYQSKTLTELVKIFSEILKDKINHRIIKFIIRCNISCGLNIDTNILIECSKVVEDYHYIIYLIEDLLRNNGDTEYFDLLQHSYYKIKDYERVKGINNMFTRLSKSNFFYEYKMEKQKEELDIDILDQCRVIEEDISDWKNINFNDKMGLHFVKDCQLVDRDTKYLELVTRRRIVCRDIRILKLHDILYKGVCKRITNEEDGSLYRNFLLDIKRDYLKHLISDKKYEKCIDMIYGVLEMKEWTFYYDLSEIYILMGNKSKSKECLKKIFSIYSKEDDIYKKSLLKYTELINSRDVYSKNIDILKNTSRVWYLYGKCVDNPDSVEYYINSLMIDEDYKYECVPRIFHILSLIDDKKKLNKAIKIVGKFMDNNQAHKKILLPFYNQILCKINNKLISDFINTIALVLMNDYKEVYWSSLYFINEIDTDKLNIDNKIYLNKIKKMRDILFDVSKCSSKEINLKRDFPDIFSCIDMGVPNKFPRTIVSIQEEVLVYRSLQAPKRICFLGDDGKKYYFLCKYKDDLRKDSRFTELCRLINKLFSSTEYYIRTYEVIPCYYNFGLIEYVEGLSSIKSIVSKKYDNIGVVARKYSTKKKIGLKDFNTVLNSFKPVMHDYIKEGVTSIAQWYKLRDNYVKTCGVINIVGWFMGLGDRHTENILIDVYTCDIVHVDLNCIFDKAKSCSIPETVPFRLTQNIVDGFGILGIHGTYTSACVKTLDLLHSNRDIVISNLLSFVFDPLHEWNKKESMGKKIVDILSSKIECVDLQSKVEDLNEEASSLNNLANMYIGWLSFI
ncbi:hypothetical protein P3W45_001552 [Vairimorpha bombi]|jgi:hypothetical protein